MRRSRSRRRVEPIREVRAPPRAPRALRASCSRLCTAPRGRASRGGYDALCSHLALLHRSGCSQCGAREVGRRLPVPDGANLLRYRPLGSPSGRCPPPLVSRPVLRQ
eukprot:7380538-Prymnesium_polylepis.2